MTPRRPSTAPNDAGLQRIPFSSAEALLWWPELRKQHAWLLTEMRALQTQHDAYNTRIQTAEAAAEAAEAATSRIRHMEQQLQAMEAVDKDKAFEEWAAAEITQLKIFVERNGTVRQKQIELEKEVENIKEGVAGLRDVPGEFTMLLRRVEGLEKERRLDERKIKALEKEIGELRAGGQSEGVKKGSSAAELNDSRAFHKMKIPHRVQDVDDLDDTTETEDEGPVRPHKPIGQQIQVLRDPLNELMIPEDEPVRPLLKALPVTSARQRLFQRPSIHNSKLPKAFEEIPSGAAAAEPHTRRTAVPPPTQIVNRTNPRKRKGPEFEIYTERITRSQLKNQEQSAGQADKSRSSRRVAVEPTVTKRKTPGAAPALAKGFAQSAQPVSGRMREQKKLDSVLGTSNPPEATQLITTSPSKRRKLDAAPPSRTAQALGKTNDGDRPLQYAQDVLNSSPRKVPPKPATCTTCRQRHRACNRARPVCEECAKRSVICHYSDSAGKVTQVLKSKPSSPRKKPVQEIVTADPGPGPKTGTEQGSSSRIISPGKSKTSANTDHLPAFASSSTTASSRRRAMPDIADYETYLRMRAEDKIP